MTIRTFRFLLASSVVTLLAGCRSDLSLRPDAAAVPPTVSTAKNERTLAIELTTPSHNDDGMMFTIEGPNIVDVSRAEGFDVLTTGPAESHGRTTINALVLGPLRSGVIAWLIVQGTNSGQPYNVTVTQVAAGASEGFVQRFHPDAYTLVVRP